MSLQLFEPSVLVLLPEALIALYEHAMPFEFHRGSR